MRMSASEENSSRSSSQKEAREISKHIKSQIISDNIHYEIKDRREGDLPICYAENEKDNVLGNYSFSIVDSIINKGIYNMYTQASVGEGRQVSYEVFWKALKRVEQDLFEMNVNKHEYDGSPPPVLGLPYGISCGLAGGSWGIIKAIIEDIFLDSPIKCYIVKYDE